LFPKAGYSTRVGSDIFYTLFLYQNYRKLWWNMVSRSRSIRCRCDSQKCPTGGSGPTSTHSIVVETSVKNEQF